MIDQIDLYINGEKQKNKIKIYPLTDPRWDEFIERSNDFLSKVPNATYKSKDMYKEVCIILENMVAQKMDEKIIGLQKDLCLHLAKIQIDKIAPLRDNT